MLVVGVLVLIAILMMLFIKGSTVSGKEYDDEEKEEYLREWNNKRRK